MVSESQFGWGEIWRSSSQGRATARRMTRAADLLLKLLREVSRTVLHDHLRELPCALLLLEQCTLQVRLDSRPGSEGGGDDATVAKLPAELVTLLARTDEHGATTCNGCSQRSPTSTHVRERNADAGTEGNPLPVTGAGSAQAPMSSFLRFLSRALVFGGW